MTIERAGRLVPRIHVEPLLAVVLWGGIYPGARLGLREIPVLSFTYLRLVLASAILVAVAGRLAWAAPSRGGWRPLAVAGIAQATFQILLVAGLRFSTAGTSAILLATSPLLTAGWLALRGRERLAGLQWFGLLLGLCGVALIVLRSGASVDGTYVLGALLALSAAAAWVWYSLAVASTVGLIGTLRATGWSMSIAALLFTPIALGELRHVSWGGISWPAWAGLVYGATAGMVVAMALWGRSVHRLGPTEAMIYVYLEPVSAVIIAAAVLGEALSPPQAAGALLAFAGIWCASARRPPGEVGRIQQAKSVPPGV